MAIIDGKAGAERVVAQVIEETSDLLRDSGVTPGLSVVIVGDDPASRVYVAAKGRRAEACGFRSDTHRLPDDTSEADLLALIDRLNEDPATHGILVQLPLPDQIDEQRATQRIDPRKDVDGFNYINVGRLTVGDTDEAFVPCTPAGSMLLLETALGKDLSGKSAIVVGRSNIVGKPMASLLLAAHATVTIAHSRTADLPARCREADIVVAAVGRPQMVKGDWIKPGAVVIDVGINRIPAPEKGEGKTRLVGDVAFEEASKVASAITPVPGGVGPMTIAMLMMNTLRAAQRAAG
ncbi:MAG: bifunctional methylenetetrahydrofolate dehydrogenase/methenyltetrahydrofolate cyclohydrolase FolD [Alphaproteobacteria bacterium]